MLLHALAPLTIFLAAQQPPVPIPTPAPDPTLARQAAIVILKQYALDATVLVEKTGKPLSPTGTWSGNTNRPTACPPNSGDSCQAIFFRDPGSAVACAWVVLLSPDRTTGTILEQNGDTTRYMLRRLTPEEAAPLILNHPTPTYPDTAIAGKIAGQVVLNVVFSPTGKAEIVRAVSGPEPLAAAAAEAAHNWTVKPLKVGIRPIRFQTSLTFTFETAGPKTPTTVKATP